MNTCVIDWELVAKFIPLINGLIAIFVAVVVWHKQKEKEVFANEAKILLGNLFELDGLLVKKTRPSGDEYIAIEVDEENLRKVKNIINLMIPRLMFIDEVLCTKELVRNLEAIDKRLDFDLADRNKRGAISIDCQINDKYSVAKSEAKRLYKPLKNVACYKKPYFMAIISRFK